MFEADMVFCAELRADPDRVAAAKSANRERVIHARPGRPVLTVWPPREHIVAMASDEGGNVVGTALKTLQPVVA